MSSYALSLRAKAELERRRRQRQHQAFDAWLPMVTPSYTWDWPYLRLTQSYLQHVTAGKIARLMLFWPPRHGKTSLVTVRYPVWRLECEPRLRVIIAAYNQTLANRFSRMARRIAEQRFPLSADRTAVEEWETPSGGGMRAAGVGSGITGMGGDLILIDDPIKSYEEAYSQAYRDRVWDWYLNDLYTRLEPGGAIILTCTRWHEDDLVGRILSSEQKDEWIVVSLPAEAEAGDLLKRKPGEALCPARYDLAALAGIKATLGERRYSSLYLQRPIPDTGGIFQRSWWTGMNRYDATDQRDVNLCVGRVLAIDTAMKDEEQHDYTAAVVFDISPDYRFFLREVIQQRLQFPQLIDFIGQLARRYDHDGKLNYIIIEDKASGTSMLQTLQQASPEWLARLIQPFQPRGSKEERARTVSLWCERGCVWLPEPSDAVPWLLPFEQQLHTFPAAKNDDMVDAFTSALLYMENYLSQGFYARMQQLQIEAAKSPQEREREEWLRGWREYWGG